MKNDNVRVLDLWNDRGSAIEHVGAAGVDF